MPSATNTVTMMKTELKRKKNMVLILLALSSILFLVPAHVIAGGTGEDAWMGVDKLHDLGYKGEGVTIAIVDAGCVSHSFYNSMYLEGYYQVNEDLTISAASSGWDDELLDDNTDGHGTAMTGVIARFAPRANLCIYEARPFPNITKEEMIQIKTAALQHIVDNLDETWIDIVSCSWGYADTTNVDEIVLYHMKNTLLTLVSDGVIVTVATGNENSVVSFPAKELYDTEGVMTIGAVYDSESADNDTLRYPGRRWWDNDDIGSNCGDGLELMAAGVDIYTTDKDGSSYRNSTGTSPATAMAAGIAACLLEQYRKTPESQRPQEITPAFVESQLVENAEIRYSGEGSYWQGHGCIMAEKSMLNWYDYIDSKNPIYGSVSGSIPGSGSATFSEASHQTYTSWDVESFNTWVPTGWNADWGWVRRSSGGWSGGYAQFSYGFTTQGDLVSKSYSTGHANRVYLEFYYKTSYFGGTLKIYAYDWYGNWDLIMDCSPHNFWYQATWSSTDYQYLHGDFKVRYEATVSDSQFVGVDEHRIRTRYYCKKFNHQFTFTDLNHDAYDDAELQLKLGSQTGSEDLILKIGGSTWTLPVGTELTLDVGGYISSDTFTIQIYASSESWDDQSDSWVMDYIKIRVLSDDCGFYTP
jgi:hypothetical protein